MGLQSVGSWWSSFAVESSNAYKSGMSIVNCFPAWEGSEAQPFWACLKSSNLFPIAIQLRLYLNFKETPCLISPLTCFLACMPIGYQN